MASLSGPFVLVYAFSPIDPYRQGLSLWPPPDCLLADPLGHLRPQVRRHRQMRIGAFAVVEPCTRDGSTTNHDVGRYIDLTPGIR